MTGLEYEQYVANKLIAEGYHQVQVTKGSGDFGVDIIAFDCRNRKCCIQCKLYSSTVGVDAIQQVLGGMRYYYGDIPMVITNSSFTKPAIEFANRTGVTISYSSSIGTSR